MKNREVVMLYDTLKRLRTDDKVVFKPRTAHLLNKIYNQLTKELEDYFKQRHEVFLKYGEEREDGEIAIPKEKISIVTSELGEFLNKDTTISIEKLTLDDFEDTMLNLQDMVGLMSIIEDEKSQEN